MPRKSMILDQRGRPMQIRASAYEGAGQGRRAANWTASSSGPNAALSGSLPTLRNRSRAGYRNNPWMSIGIDRLVSNEIGTGITPRSRASDPEFRSAANALWKISARQFDADGVLGFYGLQSMISRARNTSGEVLVRFRRRSASSGLAVPLQIQVIEADLLSSDTPQILSNGNVVEDGIEFDSRGQRKAYWMHREHPGEYASSRRFDMRTIRIPASQVLHHYLPTRPGQRRGEPVTVQSLLKAHSFDTYDDAELERKKARAPFTGAITKPAEYGEDDWLYDPLTGDPITEDASGAANAIVEPGTYIPLLPGESLDMFPGDDTGNGYADFMRQQLLAIAAGIGLPYELLTGDWSKVNDRLVRAILNEFRRAVEAIQEQLDIHQVCEPIWRMWMDTAVLFGRIAAPDYFQNREDCMRCEWKPDGWDYVNPEQDVNAKVKAILGGLSTRSEEIARTGRDSEEIDRQAVEDELRLRQMREAAGLPATTEEVMADE